MSAENSYGPVNSHTDHYLRMVEKQTHEPSHGYRYYHLMINFRIDGPVDAVKFGRAIESLVRANPSFRTRFEKVSARWMQVVEPEPSSSVFELHRFGNEVSDWEAPAREFIRKLNDQYFDTSKTPLLKIYLLQFPTTAIFVTKFHHMICDGWGIIVALNQLLGFYEAELAGIQPQIPSLPTEVLLGVAAAQNSELDLASAQTIRKWWQSYLKSHSYLNNPLPDRPTGELAVMNDVINSETTAKIEKIARQGDYHASYLPHCAFLKALHRYTGLDDLLITFVRANRNDANSFIVGNFADWVMVRHKFDFTKGIEEFASAAQKDVALAKQNYLPYWHLVDDLSPSQYYREFGITPYCYDYLPDFAPRIDVGGQVSFYMLRDFEVLPTRVTATDLFCRINMIGAQGAQDQRIGIDLIYHNGIVSREQARSIVDEIKSELEKAAGRA